MKPLIGAAAVLATLAAGAAHADFGGAVRQYVAGEYEAARTEFLSLATLGDAASQYNLGAMSLQGHGTPKDFGVAVGWLTAAVENGYRDLPSERLTRLQSKLTESQKDSAHRVVATYGREALLRSTLPPPGFTFSCPGFSDVQVPPELDQVRSGREGIVLVEVTVGVDGRAEDPHMLSATPADIAPGAVEDVLRAKFQPATRAGAPVESRTVVKVSFRPASASTVWDTRALKGLRAASDRGEPEAFYALAVAATVDPAAGMPVTKARERLFGVAQGGYAPAQFWVARRFESLAACDLADRGSPWLRQAAAQNDGPALVLTARNALRSTPSAQQVAEARGLLERALDSNDSYALKAAVAALATSPLEGLRNPTVTAGASRKLAKSALQADPQTIETVAAALAATGDFARATTEQQRAIDKARALAWNTRLMDERLAAYREGKPWRGDLLVRSID
jgi:TPR repeat protein